MPCFWGIFNLPRSARAYVPPNRSKLITFAAAPLGLTPCVRNQIEFLTSNGAAAAMIRQPFRVAKLSGVCALPMGRAEHSLLSLLLLLVVVVVVEVVLLSLLLVVLLIFVLLLLLLLSCPIPQGQSSHRSSYEVQGHCEKTERWPDRGNRNGTALEEHTQTAKSHHCGYGVQA